MRSSRLPITQSSQPAAIRHALTYNAIISTSWNTLLLSRLVTQSVLNHLRCTPFPSHPPAAVCFQSYTIRAPSLPFPTSYGLFSATYNVHPLPPPHQLRSVFNHLECAPSLPNQLRSVFNHLTPPLTSCGLFSTTCNRFLTTCDARLFHQLRSVFNQLGCGPPTHHPPRIIYV